MGMWRKKRVTTDKEAAVLKLFQASSWKTMRKVTLIKMQRMPEKTIKDWNNCELCRQISFSVIGFGNSLLPKVSKAYKAEEGDAYEINRKFYLTQKWMSPFWKNSLWLEGKTGNTGKSNGKEAASGKGCIKLLLRRDFTSGHSQ
ncbi:uncharacterized protein PRD47_003922 isoform 1-T1 [Ara ararauna]